MDSGAKKVIDMNNTDQSLRHPIFKIPGIWGEKKFGTQQRLHNTEGP
jgi:hypothetical protein